MNTQTANTNAVYAVSLQDENGINLVTDQNNNDPVTNGSRTFTLYWRGMQSPGATKYSIVGDADSSTGEEPSTLPNGFMWGYRVLSPTYDT